MKINQNEEYEIDHETKYDCDYRVEVSKQMRLKNGPVVSTFFDKNADYRWSHRNNPELSDCFNKILVICKEIEVLLQADLNTKAKMSEKE